MNKLIQVLRASHSFRGRTSRPRFWYFITLTHGLLILLFTPTLFLLMNFFMEEIGNPEYKEIVEELIYHAEEKGLLQDDSRHLSSAEIQEALEISTPIIKEKILPRIQQSLDDYMIRTTAQYPWCYLSTMVALIATLLLIIPSNAISVRRLRDAGMSPFYLLLLYVGLIPIGIFFNIAIICSIILFVMLCLPSKKDSKPALPQK